MLVRVTIVMNAKERIREVERAVLREGGGRLQVSLRVLSFYGGFAEKEGAESGCGV